MDRRGVAGFGAAADKIFVRYSQGHHRGRYGSALARQEFDTDFLNPTDTINGVLNDTCVFSPVMFNEFRIGYMRRASSTPPRFGGGENWSEKLGIPGVGPREAQSPVGWAQSAVEEAESCGSQHDLQPE